MLFQGDNEDIADLPLARQNRQPLGFGWDAIALMAPQYDKVALTFKDSGIRFVYLPILDGPLLGKDLNRIFIVAKYVARSVKSGKKVLVACWAGKNRSGLISSIATMYLTGCSGPEAIAGVRQARGTDAMSNPWFEQFVSSIEVRSRRGI
jgi:protein-tyrosine phosphatase